MTYLQAKKELLKISSFIDSKIASVTDITGEMQKRIYDMLVDAIKDFDTVDGKLIPTQDYRVRILAIEDRIERIIGTNKYRDSILNFLSSFEVIQDMNKAVLYDVNAIRVPNDILTPSRKIIYDDTKASLLTGIRDVYVEPIKMVLLQQVVAGATLSESLTMLRHWNTSVSDPRMRVPKLDSYALQIARDSAYGVHRNINNIVKDKYGLDSFIYVGGVISDSRPLCMHLVGLDRKIKLSEMPKLIARYPDGLYPNTNHKNFMQVCGGYNCRHTALAVRQ